jgi:hypothetical protein
MKMLVLPLLALGVSCTAWSLSVDPLNVRINGDKPTSPQAVEDGLGFVKIGAPLDILAPAVRQGVDYEQARQQAVMDSWAAIQDANSEASYEAAVQNFMDAATPNEMALAFGQSLAETADLESGLDFKSMVEQAAGGMEITVHIGSQTLVASGPAGSIGPIAISSAGKIGGHQYGTKRGCFTTIRPEVMHYSRKYHNSPMPHSLFYSGGFAIHGTNAEAGLGRPASHGCVRISRANAARLYSMVQSSGVSNTRICVVQ